MPKSYNPFHHRKIENPNSTLAALIHLIKAILGCGLFVIPVAMGHLGLVLGGIATLVIILACAHGMHLLVNVSRIMCKRTHTPLMNFEQTTFNTFNTSSSIILQKMAKGMTNSVNIALMGCYYGLCCIDVVVIARSLKQELAESTGIADIRIYALMTAIPLILIAQVRTLKFLIPFSTVGNVTILICVVIVMIDIFSGSLDFAERKMADVGITNIASFISIVVYSIEPIGITIVIENEMENPEDFNKPFGVINIACGFVGILHCICGILGYARYGDNIDGSITLNLPQGSWNSIAVQILIVLTVYNNFGLNFYVATGCIWTYIPRTFLLETLLRFWMAIVCITIAVLIPWIDSIVELVGALFLATLGFCVPAFLNSVTLWPDKLGKYKWVLVKDIIMFIFGILALISGTYTAVLGIIESYDVKKD